MENNDFIFGVRPVIEALDSGKEIDRIFLKRELTGETSREIVEKARARDIPVQRVPVDKLNRITKKNHQGVIAIVSPVGYARLDYLVPTLFEEGKTPLALILDGITDTRNFGAISRSAECAGADFIIIPDRNSASVSPDAVRSSAGALLHIPVCRVSNLKDAAKWLQDSGFAVIGASEKSNKFYTNVDLTVPVAIVMGAEDKGISNEILRICDDMVAIPILGKVGSLNVSVASAVMLYEAVRQRRGI